LISIFHKLFGFNEEKEKKKLGNNEFKNYFNIRHQKHHRLFKQEISSINLVKNKEEAHETFKLSDFNSI